MEGVLKNTSIEAFDAVYGLTITSLSGFLQDLQPDEARLYRLWLERGYGEFRAWRSKPHLENYLTLAERNRLKALRLLAFSYLHLAYDFPRTLADLLEEQHPLSREHYRRVFVAASTIFVDVAADSCGQAPMVGVFAPLLKVLPGKRSTVGATCNWLLAHRCSSWAAAEKMAGSENRPEMEQRLWRGIDAAARRVFAHHNPVLWMRQLPFAHELIQESNTLAT
jgi:hypothetical protein